MIPGSKLCALLLLFIVLILFFELGRSKAVQEGLDTLKEFATGLGPSSSMAEDQTNPDNLNKFFTNPSKELNVPDTTSFFQNVPASSNAGASDQPAIAAFGKQMAQDVNNNSFNIKDFLPQEINEDWFQTDLSGSKDEMDQSTLIDVSKFCQGVDTVGQSLKNPSYDIRGNIPNPKIVVSPFMNSSYDPDTNIKSWC